MSSPESSIAHAAKLMDEFAERTGLTAGGAKRRYLWTDAHAVCNFIALGRSCGEPRYLQLAVDLVHQTHQVLGRFRDDDTRRGWLSGLSEREGAEHPTQGGLRIGKPLPERAPDEPFDEALEWERDGQYFHYLTKWMHALDQLSWALRDERYNRWAIELAQTARRAFMQGLPHGRRRLAWKMSVDLTRPLVVGMGQHDPLDGLVTSVQLESSAARLRGSKEGAHLLHCGEDFASLLDPTGLLSADPLGVGGLLFDGSRLIQLLERDVNVVGRWVLPVLEAAFRGLVACLHSGILEQAPAHRLAFRELGLAIGISAVRELRPLRLADTLAMDESTRVVQLLSSITQYADIVGRLPGGWLRASAQAGHAWSAHRDINEVMLATSLVPEGFVRLANR